MPHPMGPAAKGQLRARARGGDRTRTALRPERFKLRSRVSPGAGPFRDMLLELGFLVWPHQRVPGSDGGCDRVL